ncbi:MFS transporter [Sulfitobacter sp. D35]|uniref:MFS transporter n=1 Tax=Sulfitobacter sp. D35 TaxID=3083252 RepID=UPI00296F373D|nr:MFS transporter [Sulfitobacter sp. D35]MDW4498661.1 MFS transporter [Sulfitobacter sp. D35]
MGLMGDIRLTRKPLAGFVVIGLAWSVFFAQMPVIKAAIGASDAVYGSVVLVASLGALSAMWVAPLAHRVAGAMAMPLAALCVALGTIGAGLSTGLALFGASMTMVAVGSGVLDVLANARFSELEARSGRSLMNLNHALYSFTYFGGAVTAGLLRELHWSPVEIFSLLAVLVLGLGIFMRDAAPEDTRDVEQAAPGLLPGPLVYLAGAVVLVAFLSESAAEAWSALHLERTLGGRAAEGAMGPAILGLTMGIGRLLGHAVSRRFADTTLIALAFLISGAGLAVAGLAPTIAVAYLGFALGGLGISVVAPVALALVGRIVPPSVRLAAISRVSVIGYGAFFAGPPLMGFTSELFGLRMAFCLVAALLALAAVALVPLLARRITVGTMPERA